MGALLNRLPFSGGLFEVIGSPWMIESAPLPHPVRHYLVCTDRYVLEILAGAAKVAARDDQVQGRT